MTSYRAEILLVMDGVGRVKPKHSFNIYQIKGISLNTGSDNNNRIAVTNIAQTNNGSLCKLIPLALILRTVVIKFIAY